MVGGLRKIVRYCVIGLLSPCVISSLKSLAPRCTMYMHMYCIYHNYVYVSIFIMYIYNT